MKPFLKLIWTTGFDKDLWTQVLKRMMKENKIFPCASGSALKDIGIVEFLKS